jgi:hypothetical protein
MTVTGGLSGGRGGAITTGSTTARVGLAIGGAETSRLAISRGALEEVTAMMVRMNPRSSPAAMAGTFQAGLLRVPRGMWTRRRRDAVEFG